MVSEKSSSVRVIFCTAPPHESERIARELLERHLVACINIAPVRSLYRWEGKICDDSEDLLIMKTDGSMVDDLISFLSEIHPYDTPEILSLPVESGYPGYLAWVTGEITS